jgi:hypothetical protein
MCCIDRKKPLIPLICYVNVRCRWGAKLAGEPILKKTVATFDPRDFLSKVSAADARFPTYRKNQEGLLPRESRPTACIYILKGEVKVSVLSEQGTGSR